MTGYLEGLVARSIGTRAGAGATARLRRAPRFPLPGLTANAAGAERERDSALARLAPPDQAPERPTPDPSARTPRAGSRPPAARAAKAPARRAEPAPLPERAREPRPQPAAPPTPREPERRRATSPRRATARTAEPPRPIPDEAAPPARAELQVRGVRGSDASVQPATGRVPPEAEPHIEVHIGRIEVTGPRPPARAERAARKAAPQRRSPRGFGELAAARRYVDRLSR